MMYEVQITWLEQGILLESFHSLVALTVSRSLLHASTCQVKPSHELHLFSGACIHVYACVLILYTGNTPDLSSRSSSFSPLSKTLDTLSFMRLITPWTWSWTLSTSKQRPNTEIFNSRYHTYSIMECVCVCACVCACTGITHCLSLGSAWPFFLMELWGTCGERFKNLGCETKSMGKSKVKSNFSE